MQTATSDASSFLPPPTPRAAANQNEDDSRLLEGVLARLREILKCEDE